MKRTLPALAVVTALLAFPPTAHAASPVVWDSTGCDETVALQPAHGFGRDAVLVVLAYRCERAVIGDTVVADLAVSEISVQVASGGWTLLRQVTNNKMLANRLQALGLAASSVGTIDYVRDASPSGVDVVVTSADGTYSITGSAGDPGEPRDAEGGAAYRYEGRRGTITLSYANHMQSLSSGLLTVDAAADPVLAGWLGGPSATGPGLVAKGDWTGTAALSS